MVTGATTPLGIALCQALLDRPGIRRIVAVGREREEAVALPDSKRLEYFQVDLTRPRPTHDLVFGAAAAAGVEVLIDLSMHRSGALEGKEVHALNVESHQSLIELAERHPSIRRVIFRSSAELYRLDLQAPNLLNEECSLDLSPRRPQWFRDRVEADLTACSHIGTARIEIAVLRLAEILATGTGSLLQQYLASPGCLRPLGYDPMVNVLSLPDAVSALMLAARAPRAKGVFNIPGADTLPLSECVRLSGRSGVPLPGPLLPVLFRMRRWLGSVDFSRAMDWRRLHFGAVVDGTRARDVLGYVPRHRITWPAS